MSPFSSNNVSNGPAQRSTISDTSHTVSTLLTPENHGLHRLKEHMTHAVMASPLTAEMIEDVIAGLPIQGRIILRLLLIQYLDVTHEEILYMVADRLTPMCLRQEARHHDDQESITAMIDRRNEYRRRAGFDENEPGFNV